MNITLVGFMGAGKSSVGKRLAQDFKLDFVDLDTEIEKQLGMPIAYYFETHGEANFRKVESQVLEKLAAQDGVLATGGGVVENPANIAQLQKHDNVVYLQAPFDQLVANIEGDSANTRPIFKSSTPEALHERYVSRLPKYSQAASYVIDTTDQSVSDIVESVKNALGF
jgi:shikimate kinase